MSLSHSSGVRRRIWNPDAAGLARIGACPWPQVSVGDWLSNIPAFAWEVPMHNTPVSTATMGRLPCAWLRSVGEDSKRYQMLGNSVAVPCVAYIMQGIRQALLENGD